MRAPVRPHCDGAACAVAERGRGAARRCLSGRAVTQDVYNEDLSHLPWPGATPAWCYEWGSIFTQRPVTTTVELRSAADPYVQSGKETKCGFAYGIPRASDLVMAKEAAIVRQPPRPPHLSCLPSPPAAPAPRTRVPG